MRNIPIDITKVAMSFLIIFLHVGNVFSFREINFIFVNGICRLGVPFFLIVSGYYFYNVSDYDKLKVWMFRLLKLYIFWTIIYIPFWFSGVNLSLIVNLFNGYYVLWYIVGLLFAGILLFLLRNKNDIFIFYLSITLFVIGYIFQLLGNLHIFSGFWGKLLNFLPLYRNFLFDCFPLLAIGMLINKYGFEKRKISINMVIISFIFVIIESAFNGFIGNRRLDLLVTSLFFVPIFFIFLFNLNSNSNSNSNVKKLSFFASGVYLSQILFLNSFEKIFPEKGWVMFVLVVICSSLFSLFLIKIRRWIPYII